MKHMKLNIEAVGATRFDAAAHALRLIGAMIQTTNGEILSCGGETGNASGAWSIVSKKGRKIPGCKP